MSNQNKIRIYDSSGATPISDPDGLLDRAEQIQFSTVYPGGIFEHASFFISCDVTRSIPIKHANRIQIKNGLNTVFEGLVTDITLVVGERQGIVVDASGYWPLALRQYKYNRWIDRRYQSNIYGVWMPLILATGGGSKFTANQDSQLLFTPKNVEWTAGDTAYIRYVTNASSNVKRIKFSYDLQLVDVQNPVRAKKYAGGSATYTANLPNMIDGLTTTSQSLNIVTGDYLYVAITDPRGVTGFRFDFGGTVNGNAATLGADYYGVDGVWHSITITDGTATAGKTWAKDGDVTFTEIEGWDEVAVNGSQKFFYVRFWVSANVTAGIIFVNVQALRTQAWTLSLYDASNAAILWSTNTAGTGTQDITLNPTSGDLYFCFGSNAKQIPPAGGTIYARITDLACVAESWDGTSGTTVDYILKAMVHYLGYPFAGDYTYIAANTYDLLTTGFVQDDLQLSIGEQMIKVGTYIAGNVPTSVGCLESDVLSSNTSAVVYYEQQPALTDYEYAVRVDEPNLSGAELVLSSGWDVLQNSVWVRHNNDNGKQQWSNQSDDAGLYDGTSAAKYLSRTLIVDGRQASTTALGAQYGIPFVQKRKDLQFYMRSPLSIKGTIRTKAGVSVPVSQIRAGKRIKIENFATDIGDTVSSGLTFLITHTDYDDETQTCSVTCGVPDDIPTLMAMNGTAGTATRI